MSIEFDPSFDRGTVIEKNTTRRHQGETGRPRPATKPARITSPRKRAANRRNARKSTGPRTPQGKKRSSQNALKHGLCADTAIPPCEDMPTFRIFLAEIEEELQPTSIMQKILFPQIANLVWRLRRLPEAQADIFQREHERSGNANPLSASQLLAQRFSQDPSNGFALLGRYERSMQQMLLRLLREYYNLKKHYPYTPYHPSELHGRPQPGWNEHQMRAQQRKLDETMDRAAAAREEHLRRERAEETAEEAAERTQSNPPQNTPNDSKTDKSPLDAPPAVTKRTHRDDDNDDLRRGLPTSVGSSSPSTNSPVDRADNSV